MNRFMHARLKILSMGICKAEGRAVHTQSIICLDKEAKEEDKQQ